MIVTVENYADFKSAVVAYLGTSARIGYAPSRSPSQAGAAGAYSNDSARSVIYQPAKNAVDAPTAAQFSTDFPTATIFTGGATFG